MKRAPVARRRLRLVLQLHHGSGDQRQVVRTTHRAQIGEEGAFVLEAVAGHACSCRLASAFVAWTRAAGVPWTWNLIRR